MVRRWLRRFRTRGYSGLRTPGHGLDRADLEVVARAIMDQRRDRREVAVNESRESVPTSAGRERSEWSDRARAWAELWGDFAMPAFEAVADATHLTAARPFSTSAAAAASSAGWLRLVMRS
jgi:hypothetical protein